MNTQTHPSESYPPAGGQTVRLPGSARSASLHEQLYRYADDLQMMIQRNDALAADNDELRQSTDKLLEAREELDAIMHSSLDIHLITDAAGEILQSNPVSATLAPLAALEQGNLRDWIDPASLGSFLAMHANVLQGNHCAEQGHELRLRREDAQRPPLIVMARVLTVRRGDNLRHLHWILRDVTYLRETEFETQIASMVFKNATEGVMITDVEGGILAVNSAFTQITGYDAEEALGRNPHFLASGHQGPEFYEMFWQSLRSKGSWQGQLFNRRRNGETYPERLTVNAVRDSDGRVLSYIGVFSDLSQQRQPSSPGLLDSPLQDPLTRLANRQLLGDRLERMASLSRRAGVPFSLIRIDIDEFGRFNADHGHLVGDRLLREFARRLAAAVRESDTIARLGADDFILLAPGLVGSDDVGRFCVKLLDTLRQPVQIDAQVLQAKVSLGCAEFPDHGVDGPSLLERADQALRQAKLRGGNQYSIFQATATTAEHEGITA
jgi:diguanylate cyclase (GGDEF)-like protein/PAS domain S-box-containing protein